MAAPAPLVTAPDCTTSRVYSYSSEPSKWISPSKFEPGVSDACDCGPW